MSTRIAGLGWVTPLGVDLDEVWNCVSRGDAPEWKTLANPENGREHRCAPVPSGLVAHVERLPRLRRSSPISHFAVAAGLAALKDAQITMTPALAARTAVIFAISDGGVIYTRRFYEQIVKQGANAASPLLFPETVYNAPASHLAAVLGIDGASYTLVGDASVGLAALHFGSQLLEIDVADLCVVVGCEELDWILSEGYRDWRLARCPLGEGAGAMVLAREGRRAITTHPGVPFFRRREAAGALDRVLAEVATTSVDLLVTSANGSFVDAAESAVLDRRHPGRSQMRIKNTLGEAPGAGALWQVITATLAVEKGQSRQALATVIGYNQQAGAALVS